VFNLSDDVLDLQDSVDDLVQFDERLQTLLASLDTIEYSSENFVAILDKMQAVIDEMKEAEYANMDAWLTGFDHHVESVLVRRLNEALGLWCTALEESRKENKGWDFDHKAPDDLPIIKTMRHEILLRNQRMYVSPPQQQALTNLLLQLQEHAGTVTSLKRLRITPYASDALQSKQRYMTLLQRLPSNGEQLRRAYQLIHGTLNDVDNYVKTWLQYQALWDINTASVVSSLGNDLKRWQEMLVTIVAAQRAIDTDATTKNFGPIEVDFTQVQARVSLKYDSIQKEILTNFGSEMGSTSNKFYTTIHFQREKLEQMSIHGANTADSIGYIGLVQRSRKSIDDNQDLIEVLRAGMKILERQRFPFPEDWKTMEYIEGETLVACPAPSRFCSPTITSFLLVSHPPTLHLHSRTVSECSHSCALWYRRRVGGLQVHPQQALRRHPGRDLWNA